MKRMWILAMAMLLIVPAVATMAAASGHDEHMEDMEHKMYIGGFQYFNGRVTGEYVSFNVDEKSGEIWNYTVNNVTVFTHISCEKETVGRTWVAGATFIYMGESLGMNTWDRKNMSFNVNWKFIHAHDNPVGVLHIVTYGEDEITYELGEGINATLVNSTIVLSGAVDARLLISNGITNITDSEIKIKTMENGTTSIIFVEPTRWHVPEKIKNVVMREIQKGRIGAEMYIGEKNEDFINYSYEMKAHIMHREKNHIRLQISSENSEGKVMIMHVEKNMLQYDAEHRIRVRLDGKNITEANVDEVMNANEAKYAVIDDGDSVSIMVYIPHFSEHTIDVESEPVDNGEIAYAFQNPLLIGLLVVILMGAIAAVAWKVKSR